MKVLTQRDDTIAAPATPPGNSAIAVIRISGKNTFSILQNLFVPYGNKNIIDSDASYPKVLIGTIRRDKEIIDEVVVTLFKGPRSYTGEDLAEISCHGSPYIVQEISSMLNIHGARSAEPGEFTLRAFLNGKMDLTKAESVGELIASESQMMHDVAMGQYRGGYRRTIDGFREQLIRFLSLLELELDFAEEDVEFARRDELLELLKKIKSDMELLLESFVWGNALKKGIPVVILGKPNAGKSTLMNALTREEKSIVSELPGTTRDIIEEVVYIKGIPFRFTDTAGLRHSGDLIEQTGVKKALEALKKSRILIYLFDIQVMGAGDLMKEKKYITEELKYEGMIFWVGNKSDLGNIHQLKKEFETMDVHFISAKTGWGLKELEESLLREVERGIEKFGNHIVTGIRHAEALRKSIQILEQVENSIQKKISPEWIVADIRQITNEMDKLLGRVVDENILEFIFSNFCIGK